MRSISGDSFWRRPVSVANRANTAHRSPAKSCTSPRMIGIRRRRTDRRRSMSPAPRPNAIASSNCVSQHSPSQAVSRPRSSPLNGLGNCKSPPATARGNRGWRLTCTDGWRPEQLDFLIFCRESRRNRGCPRVSGFPVNPCTPERVRPSLRRTKDGDVLRLDTRPCRDHPNDKDCAVSSHPVEQGRAAQADPKRSSKCGSGERLIGVVGSPAFK